MTIRPFLIRYRDSDHTLTKTTIAAEDSIDALAKFKAKHEGNFDVVYAVLPNDFEPCP
tara:strand:+ start:299 stop:472 length:174 start_codon:yes stop_codon:yes gene_type:complete